MKLSSSHDSKVNDQIIREGVEKMLASPVFDAEWKLAMQTIHYEKALTMGPDFSDHVEDLYFFVEDLRQNSSSGQRKQPKQPKQIPEPNAAGTQLEQWEELDVLPHLLAQEAEEDPETIKCRSIWSGNRMGNEEAKNWLIREATLELLQLAKRERGPYHDLLNAGIRFAHEIAVSESKRAVGELQIGRSVEVQKHEEYIGELNKPDLSTKPSVKDRLFRLHGHKTLLNVIDRMIAVHSEILDSKLPEIEVKKLSPTFLDDIIRGAHLASLQWQTGALPYAGVVVVEFVELRPGNEKNFVQPFYNPVGTLAELDRAAKRFSDQYGWSSKAAMSFLLCGTVPRVQQRDKVSFLIRKHERFKSLSRIVMTIDPAMSPREIMEAYAAERSKFGKLQRKLSPKHKALAWYCGHTKFKDASGSRERLKNWSTEFNSVPDFHISSELNFIRDATTARRRILRPVAECESQSVTS